MTARQLTLEEESIRRRERLLNPHRRIEEFSLDDFDGRTHDPVQDYARLKTQLERVRFLLLRQPRCWWTLGFLARLTDSSEARVSARLRDLRKQKFGGFDVERRRVSGGLREYRIGGVA